MQINKAIKLAKLIEYGKVLGKTYRVRGTEGVTPFIKDIYLTWRNGKTIFVKKCPGSFGMSEVVLEKLRDIHKVKTVIIEYFKADSTYEYLLSEVSDWFEFGKDHKDGLDKQKLLHVSRMKKITAKDGCFLDEW